MIRVGLVLVLLTGNAYASAELELREKQKELVAMLEQILNRHLGMTGYELKEVDSDTSFVVQVFYPGAHTPRLLGQAGVFLRSLKFCLTRCISTLRKLSRQKINRSLRCRMPKKCTCVSFPQKRGNRKCDER